MKKTWLYTRLFFILLLLLFISGDYKLITTPVKAHIFPLFPSFNFAIFLFLLDSNDTYQILYMFQLYTLMLELGHLWKLINRFNQVIKPSDKLNE